MKVARLTVQNFRSINRAEFHFAGHTLLIGRNNVGKSTVCEALELALGPERLRRIPPVDEYDFHNANYLDEDGAAVPIKIEVVLTDLSPEILRVCANNLEHWKKDDLRLLDRGEIGLVDADGVQPCLRLLTIATYDPDEDSFEAKTFYAHSPDTPEGELKALPYKVKRAFGFIYLRTVRTGSRALSLEHGSLLDVILRMKEARMKLWEKTRKRLRDLDPQLEPDRR